MGIESQKKLEKLAILTRKPRSHARIVIYRTWPIQDLIIYMEKLLDSDGLFLVQFAINLHLRVFGKAEIARAASASAILAF